MQPSDPNFQQRIREMFDQQQMMATLGAVLEEVSPGRVVMRMDHSPRLGQQHGFLHAGAVTALVDSACGFAAATLMPADAQVLSVEFKVNLLAPATAPGIRAIGRVERAGRQLTICRGEVTILGSDKPCALMQATMIRVPAEG